MWLGASVTNLSFGPVAQLQIDPAVGPVVTYSRRFSLPAVPTVTLRIEF